jgi:ABC-type nitrate/sulfonate/bicarbonate transport system substrate-binding protein
MNRRHLLLTLMALTLLPMSSATAEPIQLRVDYSVVPPHLVPVLFMKKDLIKHEGKTYTTKFIYTRGSSIVLQALAAHEMDLGVLSVPSFVNGIVNAKQPMVAIADLTQDGPWFSAVFAVKEDSPIRKIEDLKGKAIGTNAVGGGLDGAVAAMLLKHGLKANRDYRFVEAGFGAQEAMVRQGKVAVATFAAPFWARAKAKGGLRVLFTMKDAIGNSQHLFWVARKDVIAKNRAALVDFFEDYIRAQRWAVKPENRKEMLGMISKFTKRPASNFQWALKEGTGYYRGKDLRLDHATLQRTVDVLHQVGLLKAKFDTAPHIDESVIIEAAKRLK